ncbi:MAG: flagellar biosynthesis protein FlhB [Deltaproteobacteria bacterium]|nr:flagellar biosynthesis protein FlhB [Deltaproteobacteria bacterium]
MAESGQEKSEAPSDKRREDSRQEGQVAISREVTSAAMLGAMSLYFLFTGQLGINTLRQLWVSSFQNLSQQDFTVPLLQKFFIDTVVLVTPFMLGVFALAMAVALFSSFMQVGLLIVPFKFKFERVNPLEGMKRLFSMSAFAELLKSLFKMIVVGYVIYVSLEEEIFPLFQLFRLKPEAILDFNLSLVGVLFGRVAIALVILALFDFLFQRWNLDRQLMMTKQEMKEEMKETEGNPQLKSRIRQIMRNMSQARMMEHVPKADVVVTNPTHFAVALQYDREIMASPRVVAKGADFIAQRIREVARENNVPLVENPVVAREIYKHVEIGQEIPEGLFRAVAEILAYVYRLKGKTLK